MTIHIALPSKSRAELETALLHYRKAVADLETAIQSEAWSTIHSLQSRRDLQAHIIAVIVNNGSLSIVGVGAAA